MAKKRKRIPADQAAFDERTRTIREFIEHRFPDTRATERKPASLRQGTFEERTRMIHAFIAELGDRIAAARAARQSGSA